MNSTEAVHVWRGSSSQMDSTPPMRMPFRGEPYKNPDPNRNGLPP